MKIFVVINDDGDPEASFRVKKSAVTHCQKSIESQGDLDIDHAYPLYTHSIKG